MPQLGKSVSPLQSARQRGFISALIIILLMVGLAAGVYLVQTKTNLFSKASGNEIDALTAQLERVNGTAADSAKSRGSSSLSSRIPLMVTVARRREALLTEQIKKDPKTFLDKATLADKRLAFPVEVQKYLEEKKQLSGQMLVIHSDILSDKKDTGQSKFDFLVEISANNAYNVHFSGAEPKLSTGSKVNINGVAIGKEVAVDGTGSSQANSLQILTQPARLAQNQALGNYKVAVVLVNFEDDASKPFTVEQARQKVFGDKESLAAFIKADSYQKVNIYGDVIDWVTLPIKKPDLSCDVFYPILQTSYPLVGSRGVRLNSYQTVIYLANNIKCKYVGIAFLGKVPGFPGYMMVPSSTIPFGYNAGAPTSPAIFAHEFGHTLGLHHGNDLNCGAVSVNRYELCDTNGGKNRGREYYDFYDSLGFGAFFNMDFNAPHRIALGWIAPSQIQDVTTSGLYKITSALEDNSPGIKVIRIAKPDTKEYYYISTRKNASNNTTVSFIHIWNQNPLDQTMVVYPLAFNTRNSLKEQYLTDSGVENQYIKFKDQINHISIRQIRSSLTDADLEINFNYNGPSPTPTPTPKPTNLPTPTPPGGNTNPSPGSLMRITYEKNGTYGEYRCPLSENSPLGALTEVSRDCVKVRVGNIGTGLQYTSEWVGNYQGTNYLMRLTYDKDGTLGAYRCPLDPNAPLGAYIEPSKDCSQVLKTNIGTGLQYTSEWVSNYQGQDYLMRLTYDKDGTYGEYRCPLDPNAPLGARIEPHRDCTVLRETNIGPGLQYTSEWVGNYQGTNYLMRLTYDKNGTYGEYRCPLDSNSPLGARMEPSRDCTKVRETNIGPGLQYTSEWVAGTGTGPGVRGISTTSPQQQIRDLLENFIGKILGPR